MSSDKIARLAIQARLDASDNAIEDRQVDEIYSFCLPSCVIEHDDGKISDVAEHQLLWQELFENAQAIKSRQRVTDVAFAGSEARVTSKNSYAGKIDKSRVPFGNRWPINRMLEIPLTATIMSWTVWTRTGSEWVCTSIKYGRLKLWGILTVKL